MGRLLVVDLPQKTSGGLQEAEDVRTRHEGSSRILQPDEQVLQLATT